MGIEMGEGPMNIVDIVNIGGPRVVMRYRFYTSWQSKIPRLVQTKNTNLCYL